MNKYVVMTAVVSSAMMLQACGGLKRLQGNLTINTADQVILVDKDKAETALVSGPTSIKLSGSKTVIVENGAKTIEMKIPKAAITGKDLNDLKIDGSKAGQKVDIISKLVDIQHSPSSYTTVESCRLQAYDGVRYAFGCGGMAEVYLCKWGTQTVTHSADTITRSYKVDFLDSSRGVSLATMTSERVAEDSGASWGPCIDTTPGLWDVCSVRCITPIPPHHDHDHDGPRPGDHDHDGPRPGDHGPGHDGPRPGDHGPGHGGPGPRH